MLVRVRQVLGWASAGSAVVALALVAGSAAGWLVVVAGSVVRPGTWALVLSVVGVATGLARWRLGRRRGPVTGPEPDDAPGTDRVGRLRVLAPVLVASSCAASAVAWLFGLPASYTVLDPASPTGCRVVVEESSFFTAGGGRVHLVRPGGLVAVEVSRYTADDGYQPVEAGTYLLAWSGGRGTLELSGDGRDPVWPGIHEVDCGGG